MDVSNHYQQPQPFEAVVYCVYWIFFIFLLGFFFTNFREVDLLRSHVASSINWRRIS
jgi:hypothetical protein